MKHKIGLQKGDKSQYNFALITDSNAAFHTNTGLLLSDMGHLEEAEKEYNLALEIDPMNVHINSNYGLLLYQMGCFKEAENTTNLLWKTTQIM